MLLFEAKDAAASPIPGEVQRAETLRELARQHAAESWRYADRGRTLAPHDVHVLIAAADAARLENRLPEARAFLDEATRARTGMSGHPFYVKALLAMGPAFDDAAAALADAERAVALEPDRPAYRLLLARIEIARGEPTRARAAIDLILADDSDHPAALSIKRTLDAMVASADAGVPTETVPPRRRRNDDNETPADLP
jgi:predicted Zn-dependent protease